MDLIATSSRNFLQLQVGVFVVNLGCWNVNKMRIRKLQGIVLAKWTSAASRHTPVLHTQGRKADYCFTQVADHYNTILLVGGK